MSSTELGARILTSVQEGNAPQHIREAAAKGALPLSPLELVQIQVFLTEDESEGIRTDATRQLKEIPESTLKNLLAESGCPGEVLSFFTESAMTRAQLAEPIIFHANLPLEALAKLCARGKADILDLVLTNQERLLAHTQLLDLLTTNPALRTDQQGRIIEMIDRIARLVDEPAGGSSEQGKPTTEATAEEQAAAEEMARILDLDVGELFAASEIVDGEEFAESEDPQIVGAYQKIITLNAAQKSLMAIRGGREERLILVRDSNRIVAMSVLKNPRITDTEVERIAAMRNVSEDVLRGIGRERDWVKHYTVITALIRNPRTPPGTSTNFIPRLQTKDLKNLSKDRNVPELIRRMALRTHTTRTMKKKGSL